MCEWQIARETDGLCECVSVIPCPPGFWCMLVLGWRDIHVYVCMYMCVLHKCKRV